MYWEAHVDLTLNTARVQERAVLEVGGEVDMYSSPTLRERIAELLDNGESVLIVDLSGTSFLDSTGLGALVAGLNHAKQVGGEMPIVCSSDRILKLFRITGLDGVFTIYPSVDDAVAAQPA